MKRLLFYYVSVLIQLIPSLLNSLINALKKFKCEIKVKANYIELNNIHVDEINFHRGTTNLYYKGDRLLEESKMMDSSQQYTSD